MGLRHRATRELAGLDVDAAEQRGQPLARFGQAKVGELTMQMDLLKKAATWKQQLTAHMRTPIVVAVIVFLLNMPVVTSILSRYASWMYLSSGEISIGGLIVKALLAGTLFAVYQASTTLF